MKTVDRKKHVMSKDAKLVFKGIIFDVYQWRQKQFDGSYATFERVKRCNTVQTIAVSGNKILMTRERQPGIPGPFIAIPGGRVDENESPLHAAKRELMEETGYVSDDWKLFHEERISSKIEWSIYTYIAKNCRRVAKPHLDSGEKVKVVKVSLDKFLNAITHAWKSTASELTEIKTDRKKKARFYKELFS